MIHEVGVELGAQLTAKACPFVVIDGPEIRETSTFARERVVIEHDATGDGFETRHRADLNPRTRMTRKVGVKVTIFAKSPSKGATYWEHIRRAEHVLDLVLIGLDVVAKQRANLILFKSGKFVYPEDFDGSETPGGAKYELLLTFDRGVADRKWDGTAQTEVTITDDSSGVTIANTDNVTGATQGGGVTTETA